MKPLNNRIIARHVVKFSFYFAAKFLSQQFPRQQADYSQREISSFAKILRYFSTLQIRFDVVQVKALKRCLQQSHFQSIFDVWQYDSHCK